MVKSILKNPVEVNKAIDLLSQREQRCKKIMPVEISTLKELVIVLEPFHEALEAVEGQKKVTITAIGPVIRRLKHSLENLIRNTQVQYCEQLAKVLLDSVKKRLDPYMEIRDVQVVAFLDPRFKLDWLSIQEQKEEVLAYVKEILEEFDLVHRASTVHTGSKNNDGVSDTKTPKLFSFLSECSSEVQPQRGSQGSSSMSLMLKQYVEEETFPFSSDPMLYWKEVSQALDPLKNLARRVFGCTATSAPSDRVFSIAGNYFTANRAQRGTDYFRSMLLIKCNDELFEKFPAI